jgi:hypothetical protein
MKVAVHYALLCGAALAALPVGATAQEWRAVAQVGRVSYEGTPAGIGAASSLVLALNRSGIRDWLGVSAALPLGDDPLWGVAAGWKRFETRGRLGLLADLTGHAFFQRHSVTDTVSSGGLPFNPILGSRMVQSEIAGLGAGGEALAGGYAARGGWRLEARGGAALQRSELGGVLQQRLLPTADGRISYTRLPVMISAETRGWFDETTHAYSGATLHIVQGPLHLWGSGGRWLQGGSDATPWAAGMALRVHERVEAQLSARGNSFDPLYLASTATSYAVGASVRLGEGGGVRAPVPARYEAGRALIRIPARAARGTPAIAGDFTDWKPIRMQREGAYWVYSTPLQPGVYNYAFVTEDGVWFVPESTPGRKSDGMGGHVAVLVVSP